MCVNTFSALDNTNLGTIKVQKSIDMKKFI